MRLVGTEFSTPVRLAMVRLSRRHLAKARGALRFVAATNPPGNVSFLRNAVQAFGISTAPRTARALLSLAKNVRARAKALERCIQHHEQRACRAWGVTLLGDPLAQSVDPWFKRVVPQSHGELGAQGFCARCARRRRHGRWVHSG